MKTNTTATAENTATFAPDSLTMCGKTFPAGYSITPTGTVFVFVTVQEDGEDVNMRIKITPDDPSYPAALAAARPAADPVPEAQAEPQRIETPRGTFTVETWSLDEANARGFGEHHRHGGYIIVGNGTTAVAIREAQPQPTAPVPTAEEPATEEPATEEPAAQEPAAQEPAQAAEPTAKQARGPVPEKSFVGLEIKGRGWKIVFDGGHERTRVIFRGKPSPAAKDAITKAGFYWSPTLESWNKKLTHKAFRAAQALALELKTICG